jgi:hypothetical protein
MPTAAFDPVAGDYPGVKRLLCAIYADVQKLTTTQRTNLWNDLKAPAAGVAPRKYLTDEGANAAAIFAMDWTASSGGAPAAQQTAAQNSVISCYVQDYPRYAVNPPFDPSISIPGFDPA